MKRIVLLFCIVFPFLFFGQNQNISGGIYYEGEPYLAINPFNSQHIIVAWMGFLPSNNVVIKTKVSNDGGGSWSVMKALPHAKPSYGAADPSIKFDSNGDVFLSYIDYDVAIDSGEVYVSKSIDGGLNWQSAVEVINAQSDLGLYPVDRPWMSIDNSGGINDGTIYITTMPPTVFGLLTGPFHPYLITSTSGGNSFNNWQYLDTLNWLAGSTIQQPMPTHCVSANGTFHVVYPSYLPIQNPWAQYILASSLDAGNSFTYNTVFLSSGGGNNPLPKQGYLLLSNPANANHLVFLYVNDSNGDLDIFMRESLDEGTTWSNAIRVNDDAIANNRMQDLVWADFDIDGDLVVSWRDRRNGADSTYAASSEIWGAIKWANSNNFSPNFRISDTLVPYDAVLDQSGNDFMCVTLVDDTLAAVWGDVRTGKLNIWFQKLDTNGIILSTSQITSENIPEISIYPNPAMSEITIEGRSIVEITIFNSEGKRLNQPSFKIVNNSWSVDISRLLTGVYYLKVTTKDGLITKKIVKE